MTSAPVPPLSVVVVIFAGGDAIARILEALVPQADALDAEVLCASPAGIDTASARARFPNVQWVEGASAASPARCRALAVRASRGRLVACTEDHCLPAADWCERIVAAHEAGTSAASAVVGGAIDKATPASSAAWAAYLLDYSRYMPPLPTGDAEFASDCNVSYTREALDEVADSWHEEFHETTVHWALVARGRPLRLDPSIVVRQDRAVSTGAYLRERVAHGRTFAITRTAGASRPARLGWAAKACLLPGVILLRVVRRLRERGALARVPIGAWLPLAGAALAWSVGEFTGYVRGRSR